MGPRTASHISTTSWARWPPRSGRRRAQPFRMYAGTSDVRKSARGGAKTSITSVSSGNHASCSTPPGIRPRSPGPQTRVSLPRRNSIFPFSTQKICSCGPDDHFLVTGEDAERDLVGDFLFGKILERVIALHAGHGGGLL